MCDLYQSHGAFRQVADAAVTRAFNAQPTRDGCLGNLQFFGFKRLEIFIGGGARCATDDNAWLDDDGVADMIGAPPTGQEECADEERDGRVGKGVEQSRRQMPVQGIHLWRIRRWMDENQPLDG